MFEDVVVQAVGAQPRAEREGIDSERLMRPFQPRLSVTLIAEDVTDLLSVTQDLVDTPQGAGSSARSDMCTGSPWPGC